MKSIYQVGEIELTFKRFVNVDQMLSIKSSQNVAKIIRDFWPQDIELRERVYAIFLNKQLEILSIFEVSSGGISSSIVDIKLILGNALINLSSSIILAHNHPSGGLTPSYHDIDMTKKLVAAANYLELKINDHIIITSDSYFSFADQGILPT